MITTELKWYEPSEKLPKNTYATYLIKTLEYDTVIAAEYDPESKLFDTISGCYNIKDVEYWAEVPMFAS